MDQGLKQRLVGAGVIIALAVIFIPAILDNPDRDGDGAIETIPPEPFVVIRRIEAPDRSELEQQEAAVAEERLPDPGVQVAVDANVTAERINQTAAAKDPVPVTTPDPVPISTEERTQAATAALAEERDAAERRRETTSPSSPAGLAIAWSVQLGAFSKQANADRLYQQLLKDGYNAYLDPTKPPGNILYRVYVGPEIRQERANHLRDALHTAYGLNGMVVRYVP